MSKLLSPKAWYLVAAGAVALTIDGARRLVLRRRREAEQGAMAESRASMFDIPMSSAETEEPKVAAKPTPKAETKAVPKADPKPAPAEKPKTAAKAAPKAKRDDLTEIVGIGPVFSKRLIAAGITTFAGLAEATPEHLREVTNATAIANPEEWIAQARLKA